MSDDPSLDRRYTEEEMSEIFERATREQAHGGPPAAAGDGFTLEEIQEIGREVGISPDRVERAARSLERRGTSHTVEETRPRRMFGIPVGVGRVFSLPRPVTDEEWHGLVAHARRTFDATGEVREDGPYRQWRNGNLRVMVEPDERGGQQLRLRTVKGNARSGLGVGAGLIGGGALFSLLGLLTGGEIGAYPDDILPLFLVGAAFLGVNLLTLPGWASTRRRQMDEIGRRLVTAMADSPTDPGSG